MSDLETRLLAYVDGELSPADRASFEVEMAANPQLARQVAAHRALAERVGAAYAPVAGEPVPLRLALAAQVANARGVRQFGAAQWAAVAASLVVGVVVGRLGLGDRGPLTDTSQGLAARGGVATALDERLAADAGPIRVGLTFRDRAGRYCRTFRSTPDRLAGLACREDGRWLMRAAVAWTPAQGPQYRTAASEAPPAVLAAVDEALAGDTFDAAQERAARDSGWRR